jgi:hypothetical protein
MDRMNGSAKAAEYAAAAAHAESRLPSPTFRNR